jgi:hypothetical protein
MLATSSASGFVAAAVNDVDDFLALVRGNAGIEERIETIQRQMQRVQDEIDRFVIGILQAVAEEHLVAIEAAGRVAHQVAHRDQFIRGRVLMVVAVVMTTAISPRIVVLMLVLLVAHAVVLDCAADYVGSSIWSVNELNDAPSSSVASNSTSDAESLASGGA